jgi:hypothetical protein
MIGARATETFAETEKPSQPRIDDAEDRRIRVARGLG